MKKNTTQQNTIPFLLGQVRYECEQLGHDAAQTKVVLRSMRAGDYEACLKVFDRYNARQVQPGPQAGQRPTGRS